MSGATPPRVFANSAPGGSGSAATPQASEDTLGIAPNHPAFAGHFPGRPVLPAVVVLSEVLATIEARTGRSPQQGTIAAAKFFAAIAPGESLTLAHTETASGAVRFEVRSARGVVASGTLAPPHTIQAAGPSHGSNCVPEGGSAAAKPQAWGDQ